MSLIHTCQLCGANSFDYLIELQRHARELAARPAEWMPWNYRETLARIVLPPIPLRVMMNATWPETPKVHQNRNPRGPMSKQSSQILIGQHCWD